MPFPSVYLKEISLRYMAKGRTHSKGFSPPTQGSAQPGVHP